MILDAVCYPVMHFCRVILSRMVEPSCDEYVSGRLSTSAVSSPDATAVNIIHSSFHLKTLDLPSGEGVSRCASSKRAAGRAQARSGGT